jgi:hypothetical protein
MDWRWKGPWCLVPPAGHANPSIRVDETFGSRLREMACPTTQLVKIGIYLLRRSKKSDRDRRVAVTRLMSRERDAWLFQSRIEAAHAFGGKPRAAGGAGNLKRQGRSGCDWRKQKYECNAFA